MFLTQIWGTVFGGFINYAVMISIVTSQEDLLVNGNGDSTWSGAYIQSYNTNAASWALSEYLYKSGGRYYMVTVAIALGAAAVVLHRIFVHVSHNPSKPPIEPHSPILTTHATVHPPHPQHLHLLPQPPPIHPIRRFHPLQRLPNLRNFQSNPLRFLRAILPPQLPAEIFQEFLVPCDGSF